MLILVFQHRVHKRTIVFSHINKYSFFLGIGGLMRATDIHVILIVYRPGYFTVHPPPAPSGPKFFNSENCCGSENAMPLKIFWDMEGHRGHFRSKNVFFF